MISPDTVNQPVTQQTDVLLDELRTLIGDLGMDGGIISPSVYDTAQVLRFSPPVEGVGPALEWLLLEQYADGGWGDPAVPLARDMPTLAAILAIHELGGTSIADEAVDAGLRFLATRTDEWVTGHIDLMPIAAEMILPWMLEDARDKGLAVDFQPYQTLFELRMRKLQGLASHTLKPGSAPAYSWEALDHPPDPSLVDDVGGVGHSPSATARWLQKAKQRGDMLSDEIESAERYLLRSSKAVGALAPGIVPTVWPLSTFEYIYGVHIFSLCGLSDSAELGPLIQMRAREIESQLVARCGLGFSQHFVCDVDCTAVGMIALAGCGCGLIQDDLILRYRKGTSFQTYAEELNPSVFSNAHALHALSHSDTRVPETERFLRERQLADGRWRSDKWHSSWVYTTLEVVNSLLALGVTDELVSAKNAILAQQHDDGWWSSTDRASLLDTTYAITALEQLNKNDLLAEDEVTALVRGRDWLCESYDAARLRGEHLWMGKELYSPYRVDRAYVLSSLYHRPAVGLVSIA